MNHHRQAITDMTFNPTLKYLACVSRDRWASVWQLAANLESSSHPLGKYPFVKFALDDVIPNCVDMHPLLLKLAVGLWDGSIRAWEVSTGKRVAIMRGSPSSVSWSSGVCARWLPRLIISSMETTQLFKPLRCKSFTGFPSAFALGNVFKEL